MPRHPDPKDRSDVERWVRETFGESRFDHGGGFTPAAKKPRPAKTKTRRRQKPLPFLKSKDVKEGQRAAANDI